MGNLHVFCTLTVIGQSTVGGRNLTHVFWSLEISKGQILKKLRTNEGKTNFPLIFYFVESSKMPLKERKRQILLRNCLISTISTCWWTLFFHFFGSNFNMDITKEKRNYA